MNNELSSVINSMDISELTLVKENTNASLVPIGNHNVTIYDENYYSEYKIFYISDIHLIHKIKTEFQDNATEAKITEYIKQVVSKIVESVGNSRPYLLIAGDVSSDFTITKIFYETLSRMWIARNRIIAILGNHELWGFDSKLDEIIEKYQQLFTKLNIIFLHNKLLVVRSREVSILSYQDLEKPYNKTDAEYLNIRFMVLGGLAFSGLDKKFNAKKGLYRSAVVGIQQDKTETKKFTDLYNRVNTFFSDKPVVVLTHTPLKSWLKTQQINRNWIYVNGHTHTNTYTNNENLTLYADNQVGYYSTDYELKSFSVVYNKRYDVFDYYKDGIYEISKKQYSDFNSGQGIRGHRKEAGEYYMIKRDSVYCFFFKKQNGDKYYLLNGGTINNIEHQDLKYYYDMLPRYSKLLKENTEDIMRRLKTISYLVKKIGGNGNIHGLIVDIDWENHIYFNYSDGSITAYNALDVVDKVAYTDIPSLLKENRPDLFNNYQKLLKGGTKIALLSGEVGDNEVYEYSSTGIYSPSLIMKKIQYLFTNNVIRIWDESVFNDNVCQDNLE